MRIRYPEELSNDAYACAPYLSFDKDAGRVILRNDAPDNIKELYDSTMNKLKEYGTKVDAEPPLVHEKREAVVAS